MIGAQLSHFEITAKLGEGGMGTVYRARDTKLGREVAIKVLPEAFTADADRLARFEREAKLLASLNHPNIAGIFEVGSAVPLSSRANAVSRAISDPSTAAEQSSASGRDDMGVGRPPGDDLAEVHYIVMELAEGEDLSERLSKGPMAVDDSLSVARQIAEALEAAHKSGVIHRDLKPANIKLTPDGQVKVLDFGLAKAFDSGIAGAGQGDLSLSPTLTAQMTTAGMILGTAAYMSPEQAKGEEADKRADIWSFGIVLWEMLTGRKTFAENTVSETLAAVLKSHPDPSALPPAVPLSIRRLLERCLQKDPRQRLHDIADARLEIEAVLRGDDSAAMVAEPASGAVGGTGVWKAIAAVASIAAIVALASHFLPANEPTAAAQTPMRFAIDRPPLYFDLRGPSIAISPDGSQIAYRAKNEAGNDQIFLRSLDAVEATPIAGTEGGLAPFFSPDGSRIGFTDLRAIYTISLHGGAPNELIGVQSFRGGAWADDDSIWFVPDTETGLWRMRSDGTDAVRITLPDAAKGERSHRWPTVLPGADIVLFTVATAEITTFDEAHIDALRASTGERRTVIEGGMFSLFLAPDILLYTVSGNLMAAHFDPQTLTLTDHAVPVLEGVKTEPLSGIAAVAVSPDGSLAAGLGAPLLSKRQVLSRDRNGTVKSLTDEPRPYQALSLSPDGSTLALDIDGAAASIWLLDLERGIQTRLTTRWSHMGPVWSPDGAELLTASSSGGTYQIYRHQLNEGTSEVLHQSTETQFFVSSWSKDDRIAVTAIPAGKSPDIWVLPLDDPSHSIEVVSGPYTEWNARFSPDGRWLAFSSDESGQREVYIIPSTGAGAKIRVSASGGVHPAWSPDGEQLFFHDGTSVLSAPIEAGERLRVGRPLALFQTGAIHLGLRSIDISADGRIITIESIEDAKEAAIDLIFTRHWAEELARKLSGSN